MQYFVGNDGIFSLNRLDGISIKSLKRNCFAIPTTFLFVAISRWSLCKWVIFCFFSPYFSATLYIFNVIFLEWQRDLFLPKLTYHRNVSLAVYLLILYFSFYQKQICICIMGLGCFFYCLLFLLIFSVDLVSKYFVTTCFKF